MLRINAFGCMNVIGDAGVIAGAAAQPRRLAILALLARAGDRGLGRDRILALLWTDTDDEHARRLLTKALSALRRDLDAEDVFLGGANDIRLNPRIISSDVREFEQAQAEGNLERAVSLYDGPFLDAFRVPGAPEFERWAEVERDALAHDYASVLERLASAADTRGNHVDAIAWWRKLAAQDPLNARHALALMRALADGGDRAGAVQHARIYEAMIEQELDMPPDREVVALAEQLRREPATAPARAAPNEARSGAPVAEPGARLSLPTASETTAAPTDLVAPRLESAPTEPARSRRRWYTTITAASILVLAVAASWVAQRQSARANPIGTPVIAIGQITDYRADGESDLARPLADMLATNLARVPDLRVLSTARLYELLLDTRPGAGRDSGTVAIADAARRAGAHRLVDGKLYEVAGKMLRLDIQIVDLASGTLVGAHSVNGANPFALVDSATAELVRLIGAAAPAGSIADVSTRSLVAYRLYVEGLRAFSVRDFASAERLFTASSAEDSTFAMAAFYGARTALALGDFTNAWPRFARARRFAARATDRERLLIELEFALQSGSPSFGALSETFVTRYPHEVDGYLYAGLVAIYDGRFPEAITHLHRVVEMDSLGMRAAHARCVGCEALGHAITAYHLMDSLAAGEREARRWTVLQPRSSAAWRALLVMLDAAGRKDEAMAALRSAIGFSPTPDEVEVQGFLHIRAGDYEIADAELRDLTRTSAAQRRTDAFWLLAISLRQQGRLEEALAMARNVRRASPGVDPVSSPAPASAVAEAQTLFEMGRHAQAAALFDSMARVTAPPELSGIAARTRSWMLTHVATARAALGDTIALGWMTDTIRAVGARSALARDRKLHHYVRALLLVARGQDEQAVTELESAIYSTTGYTRINYELAAALVRLGRPREAVPFLQSALHAPIESSAFYLCRTDVHMMLARAWNGAGNADSAVAHYRVAQRAWAHADPMFAPRVREAEQAIDSLVRLGRTGR